ncbi:Integral membrane protein sed5 [Choanephora cucurbitarum]|uniref:Integral membrane protein sed5 n=1 Tax=Choanephora cucurbitarum TaxID=101091 RepID=A0A1C7NAS1_9FUNG|nr:Integral membrane protein sed5 [Choanephora cucurbitarum]
MKDRTSEFYALVDRIKKRGTVKVKQQTKKPTAASEFSRMAAQLGRNIASTSERLEQLTYCELFTLTQSIKQDITKLNQRIRILQSVKDGQTKGSKQASEHSNNVVTSLQNKLAMTSLGFKDILEAEMQPTPLASSSPQPRRRVNAAIHHTKPIEEEASSPQSLGIPMISAQQQQEQIISQDRQIESRTHAMEAIESTIAELGGIFQQLATMVAEQRETIQRIDQNTDDIEMNVMSAQTELLKYYQNMMSNRGLVIKVFLTIVFFFFVFTMIT